MKLLVYNSQIVDIGAGHSYDYAFYDNDCVKWAIFDADDNVLYYALDPNRQARTMEECGFKVAGIPDGEYPEDDRYITSRYRYEDGHLVEVPGWTEPVIPMSDVELTERVKQQEAEISALNSYSADMLYMICLMQLGITEEDLEGGEGDGLQSAESAD